GEEECLVRVEPADEPVVVEADRRVDGVSLEHRGLDRARSTGGAARPAAVSIERVARERPEARKDKRVQAAFGVALSLEPPITRPPDAVVAVPGVAASLTVQRFAVEPRGFAAHHEVL